MSQPWWQQRTVILTIFTIVAIVAAVGKYARSPEGPEGRARTNYNNYVIYTNAALHLAEGRNLYAEFPAEQFDVYLYSPTCAALFYPFAYLPDGVGLCLWNLLNAVLLAGAICLLPAPRWATACMALFVVKDLLTNLQNFQANGLIAALMILTYVLWRKNWLASAALCLAMAAFIKPFALAAGIFWIIFDRRPAFIGWFLGSVLLLGAAPLLLTSPQLLVEQYGNWFERLRVMHGYSSGDSVMGILEVWFGITNVKLWVVLLGVLAQVAPLVRYRQWPSTQFQLKVLASTLIWVVIFNHEAESPTFVIAAAGIVIWFFCQPITPLNVGLGVLALGLMSMGTTDLVPEHWQTQYIMHYRLKALPGVLIWIKLQAELWSYVYVPGTARTSPWLYSFWPSSKISSASSTTSLAAKRR